MIELYGFGKGIGMVDPSPFVMKVDVYCRMAEIEHKLIGQFGNLNKAPKGKLPFIKDDGVIIADSSFIFEHLAQKTNNKLNAHLSDEQQSTAYLIMKALDDSFIYSLIHSRWIDDTGWAVLKPAFFGRMPMPLKWFVPSMVRNAIKKQHNKQGFGKYTEQEKQKVAENALSSLSTLLGDKVYFFGDKPSSLDAAAYGFLAQAISSIIDNQFTRTAKQYQNLVDFCKRIEKTYY